MGHDDLCSKCHRAVGPDWFPLRAALEAPWLQHYERARSKFKTVTSGMHVWFSHEPILKVRVTLCASKVCRRASD